MRFIKYLRVIPLIYCLLFLLGCATNKNQADNAAFGLKAEAAQEGIIITLDNIPSNTIRLWISVSYIDNGTPNNFGNVVSSFADIRDISFPSRATYSSELERIKQNGTIIFPFVRPGQNYIISAMVENKTDIENNNEPLFVTTEVVAKNGIYFDRDNIRLNLNNTNSAVTLFSEPLFPSEINFDIPKYSFSVSIFVSETGSIGVGSHHIPDGLSSDGLTWVFEPQMTENLRYNNNNWLEMGSYYPAQAEVFANIIYDNISWSIQIANTPEFNFSL
ncbi:MAG: hypothetical protein FWC97_10970 [Treponema sp.]|nr:hypothetical protein [Treponema sp.]